MKYNYVIYLGFYVITRKTGDALSTWIENHGGWGVAWYLKPIKRKGWVGLFGKIRFWFK